MTSDEWPFDYVQGKRVASLKKDGMAPSPCFL